MVEGEGVRSEWEREALELTGAVGARPANQAIRDADLVLAVGTRFSEMDSSSWHGDKFIRSQGCDVIHIDIDPRQLGRVYVPVIAAVADAREALSELASLAAGSKPATRKDYWAELNASKDAWNEETSEL